ncbi:hypothetical protein R4K89_07315 [Brachyspira intermedia]|uniref:hypothetical protein n=1 Tax=Brachyspira intermedia TaxID=84377 RepID=UPI00300740BB
MKLSERAGQYSGSVKVLFVDVNINLEICTNGVVNASLKSTVKNESKSLTLDPNYDKDEMDIDLSGVNVHIVFNGNQSINVTLPSNIMGINISNRNILLKRL